MISFFQFFDILNDLKRRKKTIYYILPWVLDLFHTGDENTTYCKCASEWEWVGELLYCNSMQAVNFASKKSNTFDVITHILYLDMPYSYHQYECAVYLTPSPSPSFALAYNTFQITWILLHKSQSTIFKVQHEWLKKRISLRNIEFCSCTWITCYRGMTHCGCVCVCNCWNAEKNV